MPQRPVRSIIGNQIPITASGELTVEQAARLMKEKRIGALLVLENGRLAGIFTERDALFRVVAEGRDPAKTRLSEVMTANPRTISARFFAKTFVYKEPEAEDVTAAKDKAKAPKN